MKQIKLVKVSDINFTYPYIEVFIDKEENPFMDIGITNDQTISLNIYASRKDISLTVESWETILNESKQLLLKALGNEKDYDSWRNEQDKK
ncbi:hypothetical protein FH581_022680 (plasmid) [Leptospira weilii]|uniref:hypothetical protein n=1 Tax=Leptospira weilii TaxID=28184 RepID=UPI00201B951C|nr:hypothetical protein [Leptospira weilii]UPY81062.1 hypothetical protein FH581_022680 [Leptospira weilii]